MMTKRTKAGLAAAVVAVTVFTCSLPAQTTRSVSDGVYTDEQATRGGKAYVQFCFECHERDLTGNIETRPLIGDEFFANWDGLPLGTLFDRIRVTMPAVNPGNLTRQQVADILAFILKANRFPAGNSELSTKTEMLNQIRFETPRR